MKRKAKNVTVIAETAKVARVAEESENRQQNDIITEQLRREQRVMAQGDLHIIPKGVCYRYRPFNSVFFPQSDVKSSRKSELPYPLFTFEDPCEQSDEERETAQIGADFLIQPPSRGM